MAYFVLFAFSLAAEERGRGVDELEIGWWGGAANQKVEQMLTGRRTNRETDRWMGSQVDKQTALD